MSNEAVAIVKIRNYETGERNRERLCYLQSSPKYLNYDNEYFFDYLKMLWELEKLITKKDINYEIELVDEQDIAVERFNKRLKGEKLINFYTYDRKVFMDFIEYLVEKTDDNCLSELLKDFHGKISLFNKGTDEFCRLRRYIDYMSTPAPTQSNKKGKSKIR